MSREIYNPSFYGVAKAYPSSIIREVPDTQEVFISPSSNASYVIEILQKVEPSDPKDAARSLHHDTY